MSTPIGDEIQLKQRVQETASWEMIGVIKKRTKVVEKRFPEKPVRYG